MEIAGKLWGPSEEFSAHSNLKQYWHWLESKKNLHFENYQSLWEWSTIHLDQFWESIWQYFEVIHHKSYTEIRSNEPMPKTKWFSGSTLNYAENVFRNSNSQNPAIVFASEQKKAEEISWSELKTKVASLRFHLKGSGISKGDCVVAFLPNIPEAIISFLAVNSLGAVWSSCSPDFGTGAVVDRFAQIKPKVLITVDGYRYGGKAYDKSSANKDLVSKLTTLEEIILVPNLKNEKVDLGKEYVQWEEVVSKKADLFFEEVEFGHPIWVLYSSGTTGLPKAITHSHGGVLLEHLKYLSFHNNIKERDRCFWYTTTGWMMWNYIVASLLVKGTVVLYDGSPAYPDMNVLWKFAEEAGITHFGTSAGFVVANIKADTHPGRDFDLTKLVSIGSTGSPLPPEGFDWLYNKIDSKIWVASISGGTDVCSAFVGGNPTLPVYRGEIQCRALGCRLEAFDEDGKSVYDKVGEMVITRPMPSMPIFLWNDPEYVRYTESYFEMYPHIWRHGDWIKITIHNGVIIYGRSDSTLNRGGIRIGTSEIYRAVDKVEEVKDSLIICLENENGEFYMPLFISLNQNRQLNEGLKNKIKKIIREENTPRHVPDEIIEIKEVPYTISGKKVETPVKKILSGKSVDRSLNKDALRNPEALDFFINFAKSIKK